MQGSRQVVRVTREYRLYEPFYLDKPKRAVLVRLAKAWEKGQDISDLLVPMGDWLYGEVVVALHLLARHASPELSSECRCQLAVAG